MKRFSLWQVDLLPSPETHLNKGDTPLNARIVPAVFLALVVVLGVVAALVTSPAPVKAQTKKNAVCIVYDIGGRGDLGFNDMAYLGAQMVHEKLGLKIVALSSMSQDDYLPNLRTLAKQGNCVIIIGVGFLMTDAVKEVAKEYPNQLFAGVDEYIPNMKNVIGIVFRENEGSALAGALAALIAIHYGASKVGLVLGMEIPVLYKFEAGYRYGVWWAVHWYKWKFGQQKNIEVLYQYTGTFKDPAKGKEAAMAQLQQGAIVIYNVAGATGLGIFDAVQQWGTEHGKTHGPPFAIGVDSDQDWIKPGWIIASMMKRVDMGVYYATKKALEYEEGKISSYGGIMSLGIKEKGTVLSSINDLYTFMKMGVEEGVIKPSQEQEIVQKVKAIRESLPPWIWQAVDELKQEILSGKVHVPAPMTKKGIEEVRVEYSVASPNAKGWSLPWTPPTAVTTSSTTTTSSSTTPAHTSTVTTTVTQHVSASPSTVTVTRTVTKSAVSTVTTTVTHQVTTTNWGIAGGLLIIGLIIGIIIGWAAKRK